MQTSSQVMFSKLESSFNYLPPVIKVRLDREKPLLSIEEKTFTMLPAIMLAALQGIVCLAVFSFVPPGYQMWLVAGTVSLWFLTSVWQTVRSPARVVFFEGRCSVYSRAGQAMIRLALEHVDFEISAAGRVYKIWLIGPGERQLAFKGLLKNQAEVIVETMEIAKETFAKAGKS